MQSKARCVGGTITNKPNSGAIAFSREVGRPGGQPRGGIALGHPPSPIPGFHYGGRPDRRRGEYIASAVVVSLCAKGQRRRKSGLRASGANRHVVLSFSRGGRSHLLGTLVHLLTYPRPNSTHINHRIISHTLACHVFLHYQTFDFAFQTQHNFRSAPILRFERN